MTKDPKEEKRRTKPKTNRRRTRRKKVNNKDHAKKPQERSFRERIYKNGNITETYLTREEVKRLNPNDVDFHWDKAFAKAVIRKQDGTRIKLCGDQSRFGWITEPLLITIMDLPGQLLTQRDLVLITRLVSFARSNRVSARKAKLRRIFGEVRCPSWFFIGNRDPFTVGWNENRTWRVIEFAPNSSRVEDQGKEQHDANGGIHNPSQRKTTY